MSRRVVKWLCALVVAAGAAWWMFYTPYRPQDVLQTLPAETVFVSAHRNLASRWGVLCTNPVTRILLSTLGAQPDELAALSADPESRRWIDLLASDEGLLAFVPSIGSVREPFWVIATWLGPRSQRLRWTLNWTQSPELIRLPAHNGWPIWELRSVEPPLVFSITEGVGVGVLGSDARALHAILDVLDRRRPPLTSNIAFKVHSDQWFEPDSPKDRGWVRWDVVSGGSSKTYVYHLDALTERSLAARIRWSSPWAAVLAPANSDRIKAFGGILGEAAGGAVLASRAAVMSVLAEWLAPSTVQLVRNILASAPSDLLALAVLREPYSGRFKGLKLPTLVLGIPVSREFDVVEKTSDVLDRLNSDFRWGLVPYALSDNVIAIEATASNWLAGIPAGNCPGVLARDGWLLVATHSGALTQLVARSASEVPAAWRILAEPAIVSFWLDLTEVGKVIRLALTTYSLKLFVEDPLQQNPEQQRIREAKAWVDSLMPLKWAAGRLHSEGGDLVLDIQLGELPQ